MYCTQFIYLFDALNLPCPWCTAWHLVSLIVATVWRFCLRASAEQFTILQILYNISLLLFAHSLSLSPLSPTFFLPHWSNVVLFSLPTAFSNISWLLLLESRLLADWLNDGAKARDDLGLDELMVRRLGVPSLSNGLAHTALKLMHAGERERQVADL